MGERCFLNDNDEVQLNLKIRVQNTMCVYIILILKHTHLHEYMCIENNLEKICTTLLTVVSSRRSDYLFIFQCFSLSYTRTGKGGESVGEKTPTLLLQM